jgi:outer membrane murein-binding lipoprotein Lpp
MKKYAWAYTVLLGSAVTGAGVWIAGVNATQTEVVQLKTVVPEMNKKLDRIENKVDDINERLSRIEGSRE